MDISWNWVNYIKLSVPLLFYFILLVGFKVLIDKIPILQQPAYKRILSLTKNTIHIVISIITLIVALNILGIDIQGIVAGLGLMSFAIGLALKDIITSVLSSYALLLYKPFNIGDEVSIKGITGIVSKIDTRYTVLDSDGKIFLIPNSEIITETITLKRKHPLKK
ncbi:MAG: mechanosensitive ion channel family protein [Candidatus Paracaedibacter sp.]|jgi:small conductance mechanosensitive channel